jgi:hypothetical protein
MGVVFGDVVASPVAADSLEARGAFEGKWPMEGRRLVFK